MANTKTTTWFANLSVKAQRAYIKAHPNSKYAKRIAPKSRKAEPKPGVNGPKWTKAIDTKAKVSFKKLTMAEIRKRQTLAEKQMATAYKQGKEHVVTDMQRMHDALTREVLRRNP